MSLLSYRSPESDTVALGTEHLETVTVLRREYQKYALDGNIYFEPVDKVRVSRSLERSMLSSWHRTKQSV